MGNAARKYMHFDEFLDWSPDDDVRYELIDGVPRAMAPTTDAHQTIVGNLSGHLFNSLSGRAPCRVLPEAGIVPVDRANTYFQADLAVTCATPVLGAHYPPDPILIIEVLSPSTEGRDRKVKLPSYRMIPSVLEIVLIDQTPFFCEVLRRIEGDRWLTELVLRPQARLRLDSVGLEIPLSLLYANVPLPEAEAEAFPEYQDVKAP